MSCNGTLLPIPEGSPLAAQLEDAINRWPDYETYGYTYPRSMWLSMVETFLRFAYPQASSADRKLTARHYAPFPLRDGHDVP